MIPRRTRCWFGPTRPSASRDLLPHPPEYVLVPGAGHYSYLAPCTERLRHETPQLCADPPGLDRARFHLELAAEMADFFRRTLAMP